MDLINFLNLLQQMSIFLIMAYLFSKSPVFKALSGDVLLIQHQVLLYFIFSAFSMFGFFIALPDYAIVANSSAIGIVLAGLVGGFRLGFGVGFSAGLYAFYYSGWAPLGGVALAASVVQGGLGGMVCFFYQQRHQSERIFNPIVAAVVTLLGISFHLCVALILGHYSFFGISIPFRPLLPILVSNPLGASLFMLMMRDQKTMMDKVGAHFSAKALQIADRTLGIFEQGFNAESAKQLAEIIYDETAVGAVGISDRQQILAFVGLGADHHHDDVDIVSPQILNAIRLNRVIYADGVKEKFRCPLSDNCPLGSALIVPLRLDNAVVGTITLYEPIDRLFMNINRTLGEGIAQLLSEQLLRNRYEDQKNLLVKAELNLIQAQVNPHFLFNALNTIVAVVRKDPDQARSLLLHLSNYFRKNLKRSSDMASLEEELDHVNSYLIIQRARFGSKLTVELDIDRQLLNARLPTFTLQPIVENAIKHGISNMLDGGTVRIKAYLESGRIAIVVEDNAGTYRESSESDGLGMNIVDKRIKNYFGRRFGSQIECEPGVMTRVKLTVPYERGDE